MNKYQAIASVLAALLFALGITLITRGELAGIMGFIALVGSGLAFAEALGEK